MVTFLLNITICIFINVWFWPTMYMRAGLEVIEAHYLFGAEYDDIDIVVHPQSIIHSMIETQDSSVLAQVCVCSCVGMCVYYCESVCARV